MQTSIIISDIHLGSPHSNAEKFITFLNKLPAEIDLIINGDVVDHWHRDLKGINLKALKRLKLESYKRKVIWVRGNHDSKYELKGDSEIEFVDSYNIEKRLYIAHGHNFDNVMPPHKGFIIFFKMLHNLRIKILGAESVHVAHYAKRYPHLYAVLTRHVAKKAIKHAKQNGYEAVTCGHTHFVEDKTINDIRYLNTGAWTEPPICYIMVTDDKIELERTDNEIPLHCHNL